MEEVQHYWKNRDDDDDTTDVWTAPANDDAWVASPDYDDAWVASPDTVWSGDGHIETSNNNWVGVPADDDDDSSSGKSGKSGGGSGSGNPSAADERIGRDNDGSATE